MVTIVLVTGSGPKWPRKPYYTLLMSFLIKDVELLEKYNEI